MKDGSFAILAVNTSRLCKQNKAVVSKVKSAKTEANSEGNNACGVVQVIVGCAVVGCQVADDTQKGED